METCASGFIPRASKEPKVSAKASRTDETGSSRAAVTKTCKKCYDFPCERDEIETKIPALTQ